MDARTAVTDVPILDPKINAMPSSRVMRPCPARTMTMPVVADDDWMRAVKAAAMRMPTRGFSMRVIRSRNGW